MWGHMTLYFLVIRNCPSCKRGYPLVYRMSLHTTMFTDLHLTAYLYFREGTRQVKFMTLYLFHSIVFNESVGFMNKTIMHWSPLSSRHIEVQSYHHVSFYACGKPFVVPTYQIMNSKLYEMFEIYKEPQRVSVQLS